MISLSHKLLVKEVKFTFENKNPRDNIKICYKEKYNN